MMLYRDICVTYEAIRYWCHKFSQTFANQIRRRRPRTGKRWHLDEMRVEIKGEVFWLWRAVDEEGNVLEMLMHRRRNKAAAREVYEQAAASLAGGQGKTTSSFFLARTLAGKGYKVLMVDADPQSSLTLYLGHEVKAQEPTLLEDLKQQVSIEDGIYESNYQNLWLIPSDDGLEAIQDYLSSRAMGGTGFEKTIEGSCWLV